MSLTAIEPWAARTPSGFEHARIVSIVCGVRTVGTVTSVSAATIVLGSAGRLAVATVQKVGFCVTARTVAIACFAKIWRGNAIVY